MQSALHKVVGPEEVHPKDLGGRVAIVTGGALGIGFEISRALSHAGCQVTMVNRKEDQGQSKESPDAKVDWKECDMGHLKQVKTVFSKFIEDLDRLDYLILSAGIDTNQYGLDADGIDRHFGVNHLGQFYVVNQLWPLLPSEVHRMAPKMVHFGSFEEINDDTLGPTELYGRTKLALILLVKYGLAGKACKGIKRKIYAISVHSGAVNTAMQQQWKDAYPGINAKLLSYAMQAFGRDVEQGSYSALWALTAPEIEEKDLNSHYFGDSGQPGQESSKASDHLLGAALWDLSHRLVKEKVGGDDALVDWYADR